MAQNLELTEEAVRQRLSRGRKLLQEEVAGVCGRRAGKNRAGQGVHRWRWLPRCLWRSLRCKAASVGAAVAKGGAGAKSAFSLGALGGLAGHVGRRSFLLEERGGRNQIAARTTADGPDGLVSDRLLRVSLGAGFYWLPRLARQPSGVGIGLALLILANVINGVVTFDYLGRRRVEIRMEEGTLADAAWSGPGKETDRKALRKTTKLMIPFLLMFVVGERRVALETALGPQQRGGGGRSIGAMLGLSKVPTPAHFPVSTAPANLTFAAIFAESGCALAADCFGERTAGRSVAVLSESCCGKTGGDFRVPGCAAWVGVCSGRCLFMSYLLWFSLGNAKWPWSRRQSLIGSPKPCSDRKRSSNKSMRPCFRN